MKYKFLNQKGKSLVSAHGSTKWRIGEWQHEDGAIKACKNGFHCSGTIREAFSYVQGSVLAIVETKGKSAIEEDKSAWSDMRLVKAYKWEKKDSVALAIYAAELVIDIYEKKYSNDDQPRKAIEAARKVLEHDTVANRKIAAAYAANAAANAASAAANAAYAYAAYAANAAYAAYAVAYAAAYAANAAANAANAAYAAKKQLNTKIEAWFKKHLKELKEIK